MSFFSIIIPIYNNKEKEMTDCFASISQQQYKDFEVIVIDDGSNETCAKNIDYLSKKFFTRYRVIHTANNGVSKGVFSSSSSSSVSSSSISSVSYSQQKAKYHRHDQG